MDKNKRQEIFEKSTIKTNTVKISANTESLKNKIKMNIEEGSDIVHWYIKFNIPLDASSISKKSMNVTETNGYILETIIDYDKEKNFIVISPADIYLQNQYYLLNITKKVKSEKGQKLKRDIHIMFKLVANEISEFKILQSTVKIPKPKPRTPEYRKELIKKIEVERKTSSTKIYSIDESVFRKVPQYKLPYAPVKINPVMAILGLVVSVISVVLSSFYISMAGLVLMILGIVHIVIQIIKPINKSMLLYNFGVILFNASNYKGAQNKFNASLAASEDNEMAEYALNKVVHYL